MAPAYEPVPSDLAEDERRFLDLVAPFGVDWIKTRQDLAANHGIGRYCDWKDVVTLPPCSAISDAPLALHMYADAETMDMPPEYLFANYMPHGLAESNHRDIEAQLQGRLGKPVVADTSNCLVREWRFGVFTVELHTFPPQRQDRFTRSSSLHEYDPRLAVASTISLKSAYAHACPDGSLLPVAALIEAAGSGADADGILHLDARNLRAGRAWKWPSRRYSRRNPRALARSLPADRTVAWVHPAGRVGLSMRDESLVAPRTPEARLVLVRIAPARGSGGSVLELDLRPGTPSPALTQRVHLLDGDEQDSLDVAALLLSTFWDLPLAHEAAIDD